MIPLSIRVNLYRKGGFFCNRNSINLIFYPRDSTKIWRCERDELLYIDWFLNIHTICSGFICIYIFNTPLSLVGPRPPVTYHPYKFEDYDDIQLKRFKMRPGMTGLAQVNVRNSVNWDERIIYDVKYIEEFNILLDIKILLLTIVKVFNREGIYAHVDSEEVRNISVDV